MRGVIVTSWFILSCRCHAACRVSCKHGDLNPVAETLDRSGDRSGSSQGCSTCTRKKSTRPQAHNQQKTACMQERERLHCSSNTSAVSRTSLTTHSMTETTVQAADRKATHYQRDICHSEGAWCQGSEKKQRGQEGAHSAPGLSVVGWCVKGMSHTLADSQRPSSETHHHSLSPNTRSSLPHVRKVSQTPL